MEKRRMCPNCRAFITTDDKVCPYCQAQVGARAVDRRPSFDGGGMLSGDRFATSLILLINTGLLIGTLLRSSQGGPFALDPDLNSLQEFGAKVPIRILQGQWWRLITAGFLHGGIFHYLMNSYVLFSLGPQVNSAFGTSRFWVIYFVSNFAGFLASFYFVPAPSIGASAGICGLSGAMVALGTRERHSLAGALRGQFVMWMVINLAIGFSGFFAIDNAAHIGGFVGGFAVAYLAGSQTYIESKESLWKVLALVALGITVYAFVRMFLWLMATS